MAWRGILRSHSFLSLSVLPGHCEVSSATLPPASCCAVLMLLWQTVPQTTELVTMDQNVWHQRPNKWFNDKSFKSIFLKYFDTPVEIQPIQWADPESSLCGRKHVFRKGHLNTKRLLWYQVDNRTNNSFSRDEVSYPFTACLGLGEWEQFCLSQLCLEFPNQWPQTSQHIRLLSERLVKMSDSSSV